MKRHLIQGLCMLGLAVSIPLTAYKFEFKNFVPKELVVDFALGLSGEKVTVPAMKNGVPGVMSQSYDQKPGDCFGALSLVADHGSPKIGEPGKGMQDVFITTMRYTIPSSKGTSKETFEWLTARKLFNDADNQAQGYWRKLDGFDRTICYDRTFAIIELNGKYTLVTWM